MKLGKTESEVYLEKMSTCRDIVKKILDFGVTDKQKRQIIYLLSLEIEDRNTMLKIVDTINSENIDNNETKILGLD